MEPLTGMDEQERESISGILEVIKAQSTTLETFREDHSGQAASIEERARDTFQNQYMVSYYDIMNIFGKWTQFLLEHILLFVYW